MIDFVRIIDRMIGPVRSCSRIALQIKSDHAFGKYSHLIEDIMWEKNAFRILVICLSKIIWLFRDNKFINNFYFRRIPIFRYYIKFLYNRKLFREIDSTILCYFMSLINFNRWKTRLFILCIWYFIILNHVYLSDKIKNFKS